MSHTVGLTKQQAVSESYAELWCCRFWVAGGGFREARPYDIWSVGIVWLEMLFGTPHVFSITDRMKAVLHQALQLDHQPQVNLAACFQDCHVAASGSSLNSILDRNAATSRE